jgi:hypothetical protein
MSRHRYPANLRAVLGALRDAGFRPAIRRGKHFRVEWINGDGQLYAVTVSNSPSSWNAGKMALCDVTRAMRPAEARP